MSIEIPEDLYQQAAEIAKAQGTSVDAVFESAFVQQMAHWNRIRARGERGHRKTFLAVLDKVADADPAPGDTLT
jgi:uncharacterized protein YdaU (DUF1376 family)